MESKIFYFVILFMLLLVYVFMFSISNSANTIESIIECLVIILVGISALFYIKWSQTNTTRESFTDTLHPQGMANIVSNILADTKSLSTTSNLLNSVNIPKAGFNREVVGVVRTIEVEDITPIARGLTVYYSTFNAKSYDETKTWSNISPFLMNSKTCGDVPFDQTHFLMSKNPSDELRHGISLGAMTMAGPKSYHAGIDANGDFTYFIMIKMDISSDSSKNQYELIKMYANTANNNGFSMDVIVTNLGPSGVASGKIRIALGRDWVETSPFEMNSALTYLLTVVKVNNTISCSVTHEISPQDVRRPLDSARIERIEDIGLSNKEIQLNRGQVSGRIFAMGFYNRGIHAADVLTLSKHLFDELKKSSDEYLQYRYTLNQFQSQLTMIQACPLTKEICDACSEISDWSNFFNVINTAREPCLKAIAGFCVKNPTHEYCSCWNPAYPLHGSSVCTNVKNYFKVQTVVAPSDVCSVDLQNLTESQLSFIRGRYMNNLCPNNKTTSGPGKQFVSQEDEDEPSLLRIEPLLPIRKTNALPMMSIDESKYTDPNVMPSDYNIGDLDPSKHVHKKERRDIPDLRVIESGITKPEEVSNTIHKILDNKVQDSYQLKYDPTVDKTGGFWSWMFGKKD